MADGQTREIGQLAHEVERQLSKNTARTTLYLVFVLVGIVVTGLVGYGVWVVKQASDRAECVDDIELEYEATLGEIVVAALSGDREKVQRLGPDLEVSVRRLKKANDICE